MIQRFLDRFWTAKYFLKNDKTDKTLSEILTSLFMYVIRANIKILNLLDIALKKLSS